MTEKVTRKSDEMELDGSECDSGDDWEEGESIHCDPITCLFCTEEFKLYIEATLHLQTAHNFNLAKIVKKLGLDDYTYRKLVNYIRLEKAKPSDITNMQDGQAWENNKYLTPVKQDDGWLMLDIEDIDDDTEEKDEEKPNKQLAFPVNSENGCVTLSEVHFAELQKTIQALKAQLDQKEVMCYLAKQQIEEMQLKVQSIVLDDDNNKDGAKYDDTYLKGYSHFGVHYGMLTETAEILSHREESQINPNMIKNWASLKLGCKACDFVPGKVTKETDEMELDGSECDSKDDSEAESIPCVPITCLFCKEEFKLYIEATLHLQTAHNFNLAKIVKKLGLDDYTYRKLINYVRLENAKPSDIANMQDAQAWESNKYLTPVIQDDGWLMLDIDDIQDDKAEKDEERPNKQLAYPVNSENGCVTLSEVHFAELQRTIQALKAQLDQREMVCYLAKQQIKAMQLKVQSIVLDEDSEEDRASRCVKSIGVNDDDGYFRSYSHFAIHHEMLTDTVRTESYRDALLTNSHMFSNCVMLDVGCGTGILSMFAAKSGCGRVISVDQSDVIYHAMDIVRENNLDNIIELKKGRLEDIELGVEKVDAIVSEWMGYFLLFEGMLDTVIYARDHYLKPGGKLLPNKCSLSIVGSGDTKRYIDLVDYWSNVYGFKMSCMKTKVVKEPSIEISSLKDLVTNVAEIQAFDLYSVDTKCVNFTAPFEFTVNKTGSLTAIVGYFDVYFNDLDNPISFSTGPHAPATHWKQTVFSLIEPISITEGEIICGKLICRRHATDVRGLVVTIHIKDFSQVYYLD